MSADIFGALVAIPLFALIVALPGALIADVLDAPGFHEARDGLERAGISLVAGAACLPVLLDLAGHFGPRAMAGCAVALAAAGAFRFFGQSPRPWKDPAIAPWALFAILAVWIVVSILLLVDWPDGDGLRRSLQSADHVKHAAATWTIARSGTPPENPTFHDPAHRTAYYYFFYNLTAVTAVLGAPLGVLARHAAWAGIVVSGIALFAFGRLVHLRSGAEAALGRPATTRLWPWLLILLLTTGLDILPVTLIGKLVFGLWISDYEAWDTQVTSWLNTVLWTPHHLVGLMAAWIGFLALARSGANTSPPGWRHIVLAALAFASMAGLSVYVALVAALTGGAWFVYLLATRRVADALALAAAGLGAAVFSGPWLLSLVTGRAIGPGEMPIGFEIRALPVLDVFVIDPSWRPIGRLLAAPLAYAIEFGVYLLGAVIYWRRAGRRGLDGDVAKLLVIATTVAFLIGTFLRSTVLLNDLGWRVMLFAQLAMLIWTLASIRGGLFETSARLGSMRPIQVLWLCIALGYAAALYGIVQFRLNTSETPAEVALAPAERDAWAWMSAHLPDASIAQENPDRSRAFAYGLYGRFPAAVSDRYNGLLFGSSKAAVDDRIAALRPLFVDPALPADAALALARKFDIDAIVIRSLDPVFEAPKAWPWILTPIYANAAMRVFAVPKADAGGNLE